MAEESTLARPYAQAVFDLAKEKNILKDWTEMLDVIATVVDNDAMRSAIGDPRLSKEQLASIAIDVCSDKLDEQGKNLVKLLIENNRLAIVPEIAALFARLRADEEATVKAEVISAFTLTKEQEKKIAAALKRKLGLKVSVTSKVDKTLLGGAIIRAGDLVIDGSAIAQLDKLANAMTG